MAKAKEKEEKKVITVEQRLAAYLKENQKDHLNDAKEIYYRVSTGSIVLDVETGGGITPGLQRFCGINEGGKTSAALEIGKNFLKSVPNARMFYVKCEGRLSKEMQARAGVKFVYSAEEWKPGTCFVFECNVFEVVFEVIRRFIDDNPEDNRYLFLIDSVDGLQRKDDSIKSFKDADKVAGGAVISSTFMKKVALKMQKFGHICIMISQVRADIAIDDKNPNTRTVRQTTATGGNALLHYANWILEFQPRWPSKDWILEDETERVDRIKNPIIGHWCRVVVKKSPNEKSGLEIRYPIKYGRTDGKSIWIEYELIEYLGMFKQIEQKGSWITISPSLLEDVKEAGLEMVEKIQGMDNLRVYFEENPKLTEHLLNKFRKSLVKQIDA